MDTFRLFKRKETIITVTSISGSDFEALPVTTFRPAVALWGGNCVFVLVDLQDWIPTAQAMKTRTITSRWRFAETSNLLPMRPFLTILESPIHMSKKHVWRCGVAYQNETRFKTALQIFNDGVSTQWHPRNDSPLISVQRQLHFLPREVKRTLGAFPSLAAESERYGYHYLTSYKDRWQCFARVACSDLYITFLLNTIYCPEDSYLLMDLPEAHECAITALAVMKAEFDMSAVNGVMRRMYR